VSIKNEMDVYDDAEVSSLTGETESYDNAFFPNVIRKRELELIYEVLMAEKPKFILDYGCGGGWLSRLLHKWGFKFVGMDISRNMVRNAKIVCHEADFIVCDAMRLPFRDNIFDFAIGISILHHLDFIRSTDELKRVSVIRSAFLFMEPSLLNPLSAFGRKMFPMEAHTDGEKPYTPEYLKKALRLAGFSVERCFSMFFLAFPVARFSKITGLNTPSSLVKLTYLFEDIMEKTPGIRNLNSNIVAIARKTVIPKFEKNYSISEKN
jgi:ubiquinone/menaquinone biosynthesis C-methylase UbiE